MYGMRKLAEAKLLFKGLDNFCKVRYVHASTAMRETCIKTEEQTFEELPGPAGIFEWPVVGLPLQFKPFTSFAINRFDKVMNSYKVSYGDIFKLRMGMDWIVFLCDPSDFEVLFRLEGTLPHRPPIPILKVYYEKKKQKPPLFILNGEEWLKMRKPVQHSLRKQCNINKYLPKICEVADDWVIQNNQSSQLTDVAKLCRNYTLEGSGVLLFDTRFGCLDGVITEDTQKLIKSVEALFTMLGDAYYMFPWYNWIDTPFFKRFEDSLDYLTNVAERHISEQEGRLLTNKQSDVNLMVDLITTKGMPKDMAARILIDLFVAGVDSTAQTFAFLLYHLASFPECQERLYTEVKDVIDENGFISYTQLQELPYLKACLKESCRFVPPIVGGPTRCLDRDVTIKGYNVPKGTTIICAISAVARDERFFQDPHEFRPERWIHSERTQQTHPLSFLPFGFGVKNCIAQRFAEQEIFIATAKMIRNYQLSLPPSGDKDLPYVYRLFASAENPFNINITKR